MGRPAHDAGPRHDDRAFQIAMRFAALFLAGACAVGNGVPGARAKPASTASTGPLFAVGYRHEADLRRAMSGRGDVVQRISRLGVAEVRARAPGLADALHGLPGVRFVQRTHARAETSEPALLLQPGLTAPDEWQFAAAHEDGVPQAVLRAAANITIAVVDTGADLTAPDIAAKDPETFDLLSGGTDVRDANGHGTFVASLAAGSATNDDGIAGFGGDAKLLVVKAASPDGMLTDVEETNAIIYAVDHGARVINLSVGGPATSTTERLGIAYAAKHGALVVAAAGNEYNDGNPVEYPAALLQPVGSNGRGGVGLSVGASTQVGTRAFFSNTGSQLSLVAPGENVFGDLSSLAPSAAYPRSVLPGSAAGVYGYASGTSFAAPEVAGAAALVFAANPFLSVAGVAEILKASASGRGTWTPALGYGVLDVGAAVALAQEQPGVRISAVRAARRVKLTWTSSTNGPFRITVRVDGGRTRVLLASTDRTSASVAVRRRHGYRFTVGVLRTDGSIAASSSVAVRG